MVIGDEVSSAQPVHSTFVAANEVNVDATMSEQTTNDNANAGVGLGSGPISSLGTNIIPLKRR